MVGMKNSNIPWVGDIPEHWELIHNKYLFDCGKEIVGSLSNSTQLLSLTTKGVVRKGQEIVGGKVPESYDTYQVVEENNIVLCLFDLDCSAVFSGICKYRGMISPAYRVISCRECILPQYADYWFKYIFDGRKYKHYSKNLRFTLSYDEFGALMSILPPLAEQQRIANFLDNKCEEINNLIANIKVSIEEYRKLKQSVIDETVSKGIRQNRPMKESGVEWVGDIPSDWRVMKCSRLFQENVRTPESNDTPLSLSQADGLIPTDDMKESSLKTSTYEGWKKVFPNDLVLNRFKGHLGVLFCSDYEGMVSFHYGVYEAVSKLSPKYFEYLFHSTAYKAILANKSNGMTVGLQNLSNQNFYSVQCICPSYHEQLIIATYLNEKCAKIDTLIESKERFITELESYKKSLIYEFVTGKRTISE